MAAKHEWLEMIIDLSIIAGLEKETNHQREYAKLFNALLTLSLSLCLLAAFHLYSNRTEERIEDDTLAVKYEDGRWSKPYYDCGGGNIWMLTYTVPFFGYENGSYHFK